MAQFPSQSAEIRVRILIAAELPGVAGLWVASWREAMPEIDFDARRAWFIERLQGLHRKGSVTAGAFDGAELLGFVTIDPAAGYLDQLAVAPSAKGKGIAHRLLNEARRLSPREVVLDVNADNTRAVAFYLREGFARAGSGVNPLSGLKTLRLRWRPPP